MRRSLILVTVLAVLAAGCAGPGSETGSRSADALHNAADVAFVQALIPHHRAGIALAADVAKARPSARTLAEAIIVTQQDEVVRMTSWLDRWGVSPPPSAAATPLSASKADPVKALAAQQADAITIAQREQGDGSNPAALDFARQIIESRTAQIAQLTPA
ncbi:DUF305 domain-containing protein [Actinoplanes sp. TBRC 11911]|uniref:DUF305 domain-containing protein n=1 Tax=Actinoplanes sp. TBRC 11911 TaxID=2729386 RepID=UPI00145F3CF1|nr:DUF305 domain-containing protein [Actinoplanes sp. TBRC 11911]NMO57656.1 DUF305 domain-containing protein [Actinoplanes sp. TBRC 11911]